MRAIDRQTAALDDDAREFGSGWFDIDQAWWFVRSWTDDASANYRTSGARFRNVTINRGQRVLPNTYTEFYIWAEDDPNFKIYGEAIDNAPVFADAAGEHILDRARTTAFASYVATGVAPSDAWWGKAISIQPIIQEIVNRPGWVYGNAIVLVAVPNTDQDGILMNARAWKQTGNVWGPKLHAEVLEAPRIGAAVFQDPALAY